MEIPCSGSLAVVSTEFGGHEQGQSSSSGAVVVPCMTRMPTVGLKSGCTQRVRLASRCRWPPGPKGIVDALRVARQRRSLDAPRRGPAASAVAGTATAQAASGRRERARADMGRSCWCRAPRTSPWAPGIRAAPDWSPGGATSSAKARRRTTQARLGHVIGEELADHRPTTAPVGSQAVLALGDVQRAAPAATVPEPLSLQGRQTIDEFNRAFSGRRSADMRPPSTSLRPPTGTVPGSGYRTIWGRGQRRRRACCLTATGRSRRARTPALSPSAVVGRTR